MTDNLSDEIRTLRARLAALIDEWQVDEPEMTELLPEGEVLAYCASRVEEILRSVGS